MINSFEFVLPTRIKFGSGVVRDIAGELKALGKSKPYIITDKGLIAAGIVGKVTDALEAGGYADYKIFDEVEPNPRDTTVSRACEDAKAYGADALIAVGGGSSMDTAKGVGVLLTHGGAIGDYEGLDAVTRPITDLIAIPTTVGTGSEVTFWSVITDTKRRYKMSVGSPLVAPKLALVDPQLVSALPPGIVASTGMDALTHAIEGYTCTLSEPITDACALYAIRMIGKNIREAVGPGDEDAKGNMLLASLIAGIAFGNSDIAGVHCMAEALGGLYDTPHGVANAIMLPYVMEYNYVADYRKFADIAEALGENTEGLSEEAAAKRSVEAVRKLNADLGIPSLKSTGAKEEDLPELAKRASQNVSVDSNPRKAEEKDFLDIFRQAYRS
ncbi:MAG: iron-containing alcohol dehydrogenase [Clostridiales Family XIII bacterium]|jgi:alcohol dehydrogenase|nr:iron-containing alcohol dehydrogenase [Clostridiales Family XIII bacterium]